MPGLRVGVVAGALFLAGCQGPDPWAAEPVGDRASRETLETPPPPPVTVPAPLPFLSPQGISIPVPPREYGETSHDGAPLHYWVLGEGRETILILGAVHGDEQSSSELAFRFLEWGLAHPSALEGRRVVVAPLVNPDGFRRNTRENAAGVDLNRNYPAASWAPARGSHRPGLFPRSEPETRFTLFLLAAYDPVRVVSLHGAAACVNYDGPAEDLAHVVAGLCNLPVKKSIGYPTPGSFGSYLGLDRSLPVITLELTANQRIDRPLEDYRRALLAAIHHPAAPPTE